jgi:hypothetical protein
LLTNAAMKFAPRAPQLGFAQVASTTAASAVGGLAGPAGTGAVLATALPLSSPRLALRATQGGEAIKRAIPYAFNWLDAVKGAKGSMRRALLEDPAVVSTMAREALQGVYGEESMRDELLKLGGVK